MISRVICHILVVVVVLQVSTPPSFASMVSSPRPNLVCLKHAQWLDRLARYPTRDPRCQGQLDSAMRSLSEGYRLCKQLNPPKPAVAICETSSDTKNFLALKNIGNYQNQQSARADASEVVSQYKGLVDGLDKDPASCLNQLGGFRHDVTCKLSPEFGQEPPKSSWWSDFWNREKSEAPFSDIPPWLRLGLTTAASAALWRFRGGGLFTDHDDSKSGMRRTVTALGYAGLGWFNGGTDGLITGALMIPGLFVPYGEQMVMKKGVNGVDQSEKWRNFGYMSGLGLLTTAAPSAYLYARGYDPTGMLLGGASKGLCYFGAWNWAPNTFNSPNKEFMGGGATQQAELCNGALMGAGMSYSLLYGKGDKSKEPKKPAPEKCDEDGAK